MNACQKCGTIASPGIRHTCINSYDHEKDEALCEAFNAFQEITEDGVTDCNCCQHHERVAKQWLNKYWTPLNARNIQVPTGETKK